MDVIKTVNSTYGTEFTPKSKFYRWQHPYYFLDMKGELFFVAGNPNSAAEIENIYINGKPRIIRANNLKDPGLGVLDCFSTSFGAEGNLNLEMMLGDVLDIGGRLYSYQMAGPNVWYLTIPKGETIPVKINKGNLEVAKLGVAYNRALRDLGIDSHIYLRDFIQDGEPRKAFFSKRMNGLPQPPISSLEYYLEGLKPRRSEVVLQDDAFVNIGVKPAPTKIRVSNLKAKGKLDPKKVTSCLVLNVLLRHPEIKTIEGDKDVAEYLRPFLEGVDLNGYNFYSSSER
jgi:hypothetical protein